MTARYATRDVLLEYLRDAGDARKLTAILRYMARQKVSAGATRNQLERLERAGAVERLEGKRYVLVAAGA